MRNIVRLAALGAVTLALAAPLGAQEWRSFTSARQLWGEKELDVRITYGAGKLRIDPADSGILYTLDLRYDERHFTPKAVYTRDGGRLEVGIEGRGNTRRIRNVSDQSTATLRLNPGVASRLRMEFGAGEADLNLGGMALRSLDLATGASDTKVRFDSPNPMTADRVTLKAGAASLVATGLGNARTSRFEFEGGVGSTTLEFSGDLDRDADVTAKMGIGSLVLRFPRSAGVRVQRSSFLTSFDAGGLERQGNAHVSRNWDTAEHRISVSVEAALGSISIEWID
jgi:hypothetical protein